MLFNLATKGFGSLLFRRVARPPLALNVRNLVSMPTFHFSEEEPPQGFKKFKRRKSSSNSSSNNSNSTSSESLEEDETKAQNKQNQEAKPIESTTTTTTTTQETKGAEKKNQSEKQPGGEKEKESEKSGEQQKEQQPEQLDGIPEIQREIEKRMKDFEKKYEYFTKKGQTDSENNSDKSKENENEESSSSTGSASGSFKSGKKSKSKQRKSNNDENGESNNNNNNNNNDPNDGKQTVTIPIGRYLMYGGMAWLLHTIIQNFLDSSYELDYKSFVKEFLETDQIAKIEVWRDSHYQFHHKIYALIITKSGDQRTLPLANPNLFLENLEIFQKNRGITKENMIQVEFKYTSDYDRYLSTIRKYSLSVLIFGLIFYTNRFSKTLLKNMNPNMSEGVVKEFQMDANVRVMFKDVAGQQEAKQEIMEFVDFLKNPKKYEGLGAKMPKGALLTGPPGTGKTLLAKATAGESGVPFFFISGSDFVQMYVGVGSSRVRALFEAAKKKSPSIIFIDEIDAIGRKRDDRGGGGGDERANTLNQLLVEMDGFSTDSKVIVMAATNRKELLDPALIRPGRFDRQVEVTNPDLEGRKEIFLVHLAPLKVDGSRSIEEIAKRLATLTPGFSGADIMNLCNEAAILAARQNKKFIENIDFELAAERVMAGLEKKQTQDENTNRIVAVHESGHAVCSWFLEGGDPLLKVTIIPRTKGSLGYAQYLPNESSLQNKQELLDKICCVLGGRVAEEVFFSKITTGAANDLEKVQQIAHAIVTKYGMSERIGYVGYKEGDYQKSYSDKTNQMIDEEVARIVLEQTQRTRQLIENRRTEIQKLSDALLEKKTLDLKSIKDILGERPFEAKSNFKAYLQSNEEDAAAAAAAAAAVQGTNSTTTQSESTVKSAVIQRA